MFRKVTPEQAEEVDAVICMRVADALFYDASSHREQCCACAEPIWVSASSPKKPPKICVRCHVQTLTATKQ